MNKKDPDEKFYNELLLFGMDPSDIVWEDNFGKALRRYQVPREKLDRNPRDPKDKAFGCIGDDKTVRIPYCHWTDDRYKHPQTVFGRSVGGKKNYHYNYSDRLAEWHGELWYEAQELAKQHAVLPSTEWVEGSARYWEMVLGNCYQRNTHYLDPATLTQATLRVRVCLGHVMVGHNWSNGHSYRVFGYRVMGPDANRVTI